MLFSATAIYFPIFSPTEHPVVSDYDFQRSLELVMFAESINFQAAIVIAVVNLELAFQTNISEGRRFNKYLPWPKMTFNKYFFLLTLGHVRFTEKILLKSESVALQV